jgi:hypothetical protein
MLGNSSRRARLNGDVKNTATIASILVLSFRDVSDSDRIPIPQEHRINLAVDLCDFVDVDIAHTATDA